MVEYSIARGTTVWCVADRHELAVVPLIAALGFAEVLLVMLALAWLALVALTAPDGETPGTDDVSLRDPETTEPPDEPATSAREPAAAGADT